MRDTQGRKSLTAARHWRAVPFLALLLLGPMCAAQEPPPPASPPVTAASSQEDFDPVAATSAYLATVAGEKRDAPTPTSRAATGSRSGTSCSAWRSTSGCSPRASRAACATSPSGWCASGPLQTLLYWVQYLLVTRVVLFPMTVYEGFFREHAYGLSNQTFGAWLADQAKGLGVGLVLGGLAVMRCSTRSCAGSRAPGRCGARVAMLAVLVFAVLIGPVYIAPLFNDVHPARRAGGRRADPGLARAQGVTRGDVWVYDASRQTKRVSANVSGFAGTMRISLNDNLLNRCSLAEIEPVMGHEIGHYVLQPRLQVAAVLRGRDRGRLRLLRWGFERVGGRAGARPGASAAWPTRPGCRSRSSCSRSTSSC